MDPWLRRTIDSLILDFVFSIPLLTLIVFPPSIASILAIKNIQNLTAGQKELDIIMDEAFYFTVP